MKQSLAKLALILIAGVVITGCSNGGSANASHQSAGNVNKAVTAIDFDLFDDQALADCVRDTGYTTTDMQNLSCPNKGIQSLDGIEQLTHLIALDLSQNYLQDLQPLETFTSLTFLDVSQNRLTSLAGLEGLTQLVELNSSNNQLSDASSLGQLKNLKRVYVSNNQLHDLAFASTTSLQNLDAQNNPRQSLPRLPQSIQTYRL